MVYSITSWSVINVASDATVTIDLSYTGDNPACVHCKKFVAFVIIRDSMLTLCRQLRMQAIRQHMQLMLQLCIVNEKCFQGKVVQ